MTQLSSHLPPYQPDQLSLFGDAEAAAVLDQAASGTQPPSLDQPVSSGFDSLPERTGLAGPEKEGSVMQCAQEQNQFVPVDHIANARNKKKKHQSFYTPLSVVKLMVDTAPHWEGCKALEPSAGDGRIVHELLQRGVSVDACEIDDEMRARCTEYGANIVGTDFLQYRPEEPYDLIVMNPPFTKGQDKRHIEHAYSMLSDHGTLVAIASPGLAYHLQQCTVKLEGCRYAVYERLAPETFKESGTAIETLLVTIQRGYDRECCGFSNHPTFNAAVTIDSDQKMQRECQRVADSAEAKARFSRPVAELGGSCYGVDWNEVLEYIKSTRGSVEEPAESYTDRKHRVETEGKQRI